MSTYLQTSFATRDGTGVEMNDSPSCYERKSVGLNMTASSRKK